MKRYFSLILLLFVLLSGCATVSIQTPESAGDRQAVVETEGASVNADAAVLQETTASVPETGKNATTGILTTTFASAASSAVPSKAPSAGNTESVRVTVAQQSEIPGTSSSASTRQAYVTEATAAPKTTAAPIVAVTTTAAAVMETTVPQTEKPTNSCTIRIDCSTIRNNLKKLKAGKEDFLPSDGLILEDTAVEVQTGDTVFSILQRACKEHSCTDQCDYCKKAGGIQLEYTYEPVFKTYYIEGIHQLYEKDCGTMSGWMFSVNGKFPEAGASSVSVSAGDRIVFAYTCDMGDDVGNHYEG